MEGTSSSSIMGRGPPTLQCPSRSFKNQTQKNQNQKSVFVPVRAVWVVVIGRTCVRDGRDLNGLHDVTWPRHAVLDGEVVPSCCSPHLHQPRPPGRRVCIEVHHAVVLRVQPVLLVHEQTCSIKYRRAVRRLIAIMHTSLKLNELKQTAVLRTHTRAHTRTHIRDTRTHAHEA